MASSRRRQRIDRLSIASTRRPCASCSSQDVRERLSNEAFEVPLDSPEQFVAHIKADVVKWAKVVNEAGIKANSRHAK